ncbi:MAG: lipoate--protein ligase family protein [Verrucomicrobiae bacterium]|nr:lipoate--protein ligase family protein [Verrucomicrobiae bacterium]
MQALRLLDHTYRTAAENLACEEQLLDACARDDAPGVLRFWEPTECFVVLGYSNRIATEVNEPACRQDGIPVYRRCSGGGTVMQLPGCLNYALVLPAPSDSVTETNRWIMTRQRDAIADALQRVGLPGLVSVEGFTDLALDGRKFSGNSQRRKRRYVLFHGSFLLSADLARISRYLHMPTRQPAYRQNRPHEQFLCNLPLPAAVVKQQLTATWRATEPIDPPSIPPERIAQHESAEWIRRF